MPAELIDLANAEADRQRDQWMHHEQMASEFKARATALRCALDDLKHFQEMRAAAIQRRWNARKALRCVQSEIAALKKAPRIMAKLHATPSRILRGSAYAISRHIASVAQDAQDSALESGVYFLLMHRSVVYVGQSVNVAQRLGQHAKSKKEFNRWCFIPVEPHRLDQVERAFIDVLMPPLNFDAKTRSVRKNEASLFAGCNTMALTHNA